MPMLCCAVGAPREEPKAPNVEVVAGAAEKPVVKGFAACDADPYALNAPKAGVVPAFKVDCPNPPKLPNIEPVVADGAPNPPNPDVAAGAAAPNPVEAAAAGCPNPPRPPKPLPIPPNPVF